MSKTLSPNFSTKSQTLAMSRTHHFPLFRYSPTTKITLPNVGFSLRIHSRRSSITNFLLKSSSRVPAFGGGHGGDKGHGGGGGGGDDSDSDRWKYYLRQIVKELSSIIWDITLVWCLITLIIRADFCDKQIRFLHTRVEALEGWISKTET